MRKHRPVAADDLGSSVMSCYNLDCETDARPESCDFNPIADYLHREARILANLAEHYSQTRRFTEHLCEPLAVEDFVVQSMPDASPTRWHMAHTSWFFETFVLARWEANYRPANTAFQTLFNSYYNGVGEAFPALRQDC